MIYQNFDLEIIRPYGGERLCARVLDSPQGDCSFVDVKWPFDTEQENTMLSQIYGELRQRSGRSIQATSIEHFGGKLFEAVFTGDIEHLYRSSLDSARRSGKGLRVRLRLPDDTTLHGRPWEFLFDTESREFLAVREHTPIVRYLPVAQPIPPITVEGPLRILVALSAPLDRPRLDTTREWDILREALAAPIAAGRLELRRVPGHCTFDNLRDSLRHYGAHIFHFVGHGIPGALVLEQESGLGREMEAIHLRSAFPGGALPRLIVLNACSGAITEDAPFSGLAQGFLRQGVPAVVAMQASITDNAALIFTRYFYRDLVEIGAVDTSLTEARLRMQANGHPIEWGTPVLYMRALSGQLFQPAQGPKPGARKRPADTAAKAARPASPVENMGNQQKDISFIPEQPPAPPPPQSEPVQAARKRPAKTTRPREGIPPASPAPEPMNRDSPPPTPTPTPTPAPAPAPAKVSTPPPEPEPWPEPALAPKPEPKAQPKAEPKPEPEPDRIRPARPQPRPDPILGEPFIPPIILPGPRPPIFTLEPEVNEQALPKSADQPQSSTKQARPPGWAQRFMRPRFYALAAGGLAAVTGIAIVVDREPPAPSLPSKPSTAAATPELPSVPAARPAPSPASEVKVSESVVSRPEAAVKNVPDTRETTSPARKRPSPNRVADTDRPAPVPVPAPVSAPVDNCDSPEFKEMPVECLLRDQPRSETANETPSEE